MKHSIFPDSTRCFFTLFCAGALVTIVMTVLTIKAASPDLNAEEAARKLFFYMTQQVTNMVITATIEIHQTPWTEQHIKQLVDSSHFENRLIDHPEQKERVEALIKANMESLRQEHSATNITTIREWIGPMMYRKDMLTQPSDPNAVTNFFKGGNNFKYAWVNIDDPSFSEYHSWVANPVGGGASVTKDSVRYMVDNLWEARVIEPENAFLFLWLVKKGIFTLSPESTWLHQSFAPLRTRLDDSNLKNLVQGLNPTAALAVSLGDLGGVNCVVLNLDIKEEKGASITYYMDWPNQNHLLKVVRKVPSKGVEITTTRSEFDDNDFPHEWLQSGQTADGPVFKKISILEAEVNPHWNLNEVFGTSFPTNCIVDEVNKAGLVRNLQWPHGKPRPDVTTVTAVPSNGFDGRLIIRIILGAAFISPLFILVFVTLKKYKKK